MQTDRKKRSFVERKASARRKRESQGRKRESKWMNCNKEGARTRRNQIKAESKRSRMQKHWGEKQG